MYERVSNHDLVDLRTCTNALAARAQALLDARQLPYSDWAFPVDTLVHLGHGLDVEAEARGLVRDGAEIVEPPIDPTDTGAIAAANRANLTDDGDKGHGLYW